MQKFIGALGAVASGVLATPAWAQAAEETSDKGVSPAFWIAVSVPIVLGVLMAIRAATTKKKKSE